MPISNFVSQRIGDLLAPIVRNICNDLRSPAKRKLAYYYFHDHVFPTLRLIASMPQEQAQQSADEIIPHD